MGRKRRIAASVTAMVLVSVSAVAPAHAGDDLPATFNELFTSYPITVNGSYTPLLGRLDCQPAGGELAIIWYAPGSAADWRWALSFDDGLSHSSVPLSVNGTYEPFVGDFDSDGCDDVFWYAPGSGADFVWYGVDGGNFASSTVTVNGDYTPLVGDWDGGGPGDDIFWYGSGGGTETIWRGTPSRGTFELSTAPQVAGTDFLATSTGDEGIFYRPGPGADYIWQGIQAGAGAPAESVEITITRTYEPHFGGGLLLYGPGAAKDTFAHGYDDDGTLDTLGGTINGTYRVTAFNRVLLFHAPGSAQDYLWVAVEDGGGGGAAFGGAPASQG